MEDWLVGSNVIWNIWDFINVYVWTLFNYELWHLYFLKEVGGAEARLVEFFTCGTDVHGILNLTDTFI